MPIGRGMQLLENSLKPEPPKKKRLCKVKLKNTDELHELLWELRNACKLVANVAKCIEEWACFVEFEALEVLDNKKAMSPTKTTPPTQTMLLKRRS